MPQEHCPPVGVICLSPVLLWLSFCVSFGLSSGADSSLALTNLLARLELAV